TRPILIDLAARVTDRRGPTCIAVGGSKRAGDARIALAHPVRRSGREGVHALGHPERRREYVASSDELGASLGHQGIGVKVSGELVGVPQSVAPECASFAVLIKQSGD